jgi:hypothetical protein
MIVRAEQFRRREIPPAPVCDLRRCEMFCHFLLASIETIVGDCAD